MNEIPDIPSPYPDDFPIDDEDEPEQLFSGLSGKKIRCVFLLNKPFAIEGTVTKSRYIFVEIKTKEGFSLINMEHVAILEYDDSMVKKKQPPKEGIQYG